MNVWPKYVCLLYLCWFCVVTAALRLPAAYRSGAGLDREEEEVEWRDWEGAEDMGGMSLGGKP